MKGLDAGLDEITPDAKIYNSRGRYINLFDLELPVGDTVAVNPLIRILRFHLNTAQTRSPPAVAVACRVRNQKLSRKELTISGGGHGRHK